MAKRLKFLTDQTPEGPIEAGQTLGMTPKAVIEKYFSNRNAVLTLLRAYSGLSISDVAEKLGVSEKELKEIEQSDTLMPHQLAPKLAKIFDVDLKALLIFLGLAKDKDAARTDRDYEFSLAAQYSGPELTEQEKVDLEELFKMIVEKIKKDKDRR